MRATRSTLASYRQLAVVVPALAVVLMAGGIGAIVNGYWAGGVVAILLGLLVGGFVTWFVRSPVGMGIEE
jgi:hypothetical protein